MPEVLSKQDHNFALAIGTNRLVIITEVHMQKNPSVRQHTSTARGRGTSAATILISLILILGSCSPSDTRKSYRNVDDALADYSLFSADIAKKKSVSTADLIKVVTEWQCLDDSVEVVLAHDTVATHVMTYYTLRDSISTQLMRLVDSRKRGLKDYLDVVQGIGKGDADTAQSKYVEQAQSFFATLDSLPVYNLDKRQTIQVYERLLTDAKRRGFHSQKDFYDYLRQEDRMFRSFLCHLPTLGDVPLTKVRDITKELMAEAIRLSQGDKSVFSTEELSVLLTLRNNRRLMQNALQCVNDIRADKVALGDQSTAYTWMLLQPWVTFDANSYNLMDKGHWATMYILAAETPKAMRMLRGSSFPIRQEELPALLIKTYLSTL